MPLPGHKGGQLDEKSTFGRCNKCMTLNWDSPMYMRTYGINGCRKCGSNETRWNGKVNLFERLYLLCWYIWETCMRNRESEEGDPDPDWWKNPMNVLRVIRQGLHPDLCYVKRDEDESNEEGDADGTAEEPC